MKREYAVTTASAAPSVVTSPLFGAHQDTVRAFGDSMERNMAQTAAQGWTLHSVVTLWPGVVVFVWEREVP